MKLDYRGTTTSIQKSNMAIFLWLALALSACGGGGGSGGATSSGGDPMDDGQSNGGDDTTENEIQQYTTPAGIAECSTEDIKRRVEFDMRDYYIYYDQVPAVNINNYETPERLIEALRVDPDIYSNVRDAQSQSDLFNDGVTAGLGFWFRPANDGVVRFRESRLGSPSYAAGIRRGDELISFNGRPIAELSDAEISAALTPESPPVVMDIRTDNNDPRTVIVDYTEYAWQTAGHEQRFTSGTNPSLPAVGYISVRSFLDTTEQEIDDALFSLKNSGGFDELIIDFRYNGGGRLHVSRHLASVIGGEAVAGKLFRQEKWNDKYSENNSQFEFDSVSEPLNLPRVLVLTTGNTASASEAFINGLEPFIDVVVIGDITGGKPFTSNARDYCDKTINAMRSIRVNSVGVDVANGIQPDCSVGDNWETPLNSLNDPLLSSALNFIVNGVCETTLSAEPPRLREGMPLGPSYEPIDPIRYLADE